MRPETDQTNRIQQIATNLRALRQRRSMTMNELAERSSVTQPFVSHVETGRSTPSLITLMRFADALEVDLQVLVDGVATDSPSSFVGASSREVYDVAGDPRAAARVLTHGHPGMEAFEMTIEADAFLGEHITHEGTDLLYLISGRLQVDLDRERQYDLEAGDSLTHSGLLPHRWRVTSAEPARFLCIVTPTTSQDTRRTHPH